jgi:engulfment/cell motility protein 1
MSNAGSPSSAVHPGLKSPQAPSAAANGIPVKPGPLVPTNNVTTKDGLTVRARIDPTLTVDDVVRQLCINLKIKAPPTNFALRDETDELVTNDNLRKKIKTKVNLKRVVHNLELLRRS